MDVTLEVARKAEWNRYDALYTGRVKLAGKGDSPYGIANHGSAALPILVDEYKARSICDVGTGNGQLCLDAIDRGVPKVCGVDFASEPDGAGVSWLKAPAHALGLPDNAFEWVTAFDLLEHLLEEEIPEVLDEFARVASVGMAFSIAYTKSRDVLGGNLHATIRPKEWWLEVLNGYGPVTEHLRTLRNKPLVKDYQFVTFR